MGRQDQDQTQPQPVDCPSKEVKANTQDQDEDDDVSVDSFQEDLREILLARAGSGPNDAAAAAVASSDAVAPISTGTAVTTSPETVQEDSKPPQKMIMAEEMQLQNIAVGILPETETSPPVARMPTSIRSDEDAKHVIEAVTVALARVPDAVDLQQDQQEWNSALQDNNKPMDIAIGIDVDTNNSSSFSSPPTALLRSAAVQVSSRPGAFPMAPSCPTDQDVSENTYHYEAGRADPSPTSSMNSQDHALLLTSRGGLVPEAKPVTEEPDDLERQQAAELDPHAEEKRKQAVIQQRRRLFYQAAGLGAVLLLLTGILVGWLLNKSNGSDSPSGSNQSNMNGTLESSSTLSPTPQFVSFEDRVLSLLPQYTIRAIDRPESPQRRALDWINQENGIMFSDQRILQRYSLATLYFATDGDIQWANHNRWLSHDHHECDWWARNSSGLFYYPEYNTELQWNVTGGPCGGPESGDEPWFQVDQDDSVDTEYKHIWLWSNNLHGELPPELYLITSLQSISIDRNGLQGNVLTGLGQLTNLQALGLYANDFTGTMPTEMGLLTDLEYLWAMGLPFEGSLPTEMANLGKLKHLLIDGSYDLEMPRLTGTMMTEIGRMTNLEWLWFQRSGITGTLPTEIGLMTSIIEFQVHETPELTGPLPSELGLMANLEYLFMWDCQFSGRIPTELGLLAQNTSVFQMAMDNNLLTGSLPTELGNTKHMTLLHVGGNQLSGSIPSELGLLEYFINSMAVFGNSLTGAIPSELGNLDPWRLWISRNQLSGPLPTELASMSRLEILRLHDNHLTASLPVEFSLLTNLRELSLADNFLTGTIQAELGALTALQLMHLHNNSFTGTLSSDLGLMTDMKELSVANNSLVGIVPLELCDLSNWTTGLVFDCELMECYCNACHCGSSLELEPADGW